MDNCASAAAHPLISSPFSRNNITRDKAEGEHGIAAIEQRCSPNRNGVDQSGRATQQLRIAAIAHPAQHHAVERDQRNPNDTEKVTPR